MKTLEELAISSKSCARSDGQQPRLWVASSVDGLVVEFFGDPSEDFFAQCLRAVAAESKRILALALRGPDVGANGTCLWDLSPLSDGNIGYPKMRTLLLEQGEDADHNTHILGVDDEESGQLGAILKCAPLLEALVSPSAPDETFFATEARPLRYLSVCAGYDHQDFLGNLAVSTNLKLLQALGYSEGTGVGFEGVPRATFANYVALMNSSLPLRRIALRNPDLSDEQLRELKMLKPDVQLRVTRCASHFVR